MSKEPGLAGDYLEEEVEILRRTIPKYEDCGMFMHCKTCIPSKLPPNTSPREFAAYEVASCKLKVGMKSVGVITVWCKHCGKLVWDSRHLKHAY